MAKRMMKKTKNILRYAPTEKLLALKSFAKTLVAKRRAILFASCTKLAQLAANLPDPYKAEQARVAISESTTMEDAARNLRRIKRTQPRVYATIRSHGGHSDSPAGVTPIKKPKGFKRKHESLMVRKTKAMREER